MSFMKCCARRAATVLISLFLVLPFAPAFAANELDCPGPSNAPPAGVPITLRVALYPYTPDRLALFHKIEAIFECENPGVNVVLVSTPNATHKYYNDNDEKREGFRFVEADVYEIDTILLADFIAHDKIAPIDLPFQDFAKEGLEAVRRDGKIYGVPRWLCGNFLFYRKTDVEIANAGTWQELSRLLAARKQKLLVDLKGKSTLGEWYLTALSQLVGLDEAQRQVMAGAPPNAEALAVLQDILRACPLGYCRSETLHDNVGFYARAFVRGQAAAFIGYSESIHYGLREAADNCLETSGCLKESDIAVRALPPFGAAQGQAGIGWVDALAIDAKLSGIKKELALRFIQRLVSEDVYKSILSPEWPYASRYLLPARQNLAIADAPLYPQFLTAHQGRRTGTVRGLNAKLRDIAKAVDCRLPIDRDDTEALANCPIR